MNIQYEKYKKFITSKFPQNIFHYDINESKNFINNILKELEFIDILNETVGLEDYVFYLDQIEESLLKILLTYPMQEILSLSTYLRLNIESILKLIMTVETQKNEFQKTGFSSLKRLIKEIDAYNINKNLIDNLLKSFSDLSNVMHAKSKSNDTIESLDKYLKVKLDEKDIKKNEKTLEFSNECLLILAKTYFEYLNTSQKLRLKRLLSKKKYDKIKEKK
ncbi:hypothetical protein PWJ44_002792 [Listeria monocytogenes]|nr:hypothetical protein [Listeria monocytogenes]